MLRNRRLKQKRRNVRRLVGGFEHLDSRRVLATITGFVFEDLDSSGTQNQDEPGLADRVVYLDVNENSVVDFGEPFQLTGGDGAFRFEDVAPKLEKPHTIGVFNGTASQFFTTPSFVNVAVEQEGDTFEVSFGLRLNGDNSAPQLVSGADSSSAPLRIEVPEDRSFITPERVGLKTVAEDNDSSFGTLDRFIVLQTAPAQNGTIELHPNGRIEYDHLENFAGDDTATFIYHDGRTPSDTHTVTVTVEPVNDPPVALEVDVIPLPENSDAGTVIGAINVIDPDVGDVFDFDIADDRFQVENGLLILAPEAEIDFEVEQAIQVDIVAENPDNDDLIAQRIEIPVVDVDDPVTDFGVSVEVDTILEGQTGVTLGTIWVSDQDSGDYVFSSEDPRIEFVESEGSILVRLTEDGSFQYPQDDGATVSINLQDPARPDQPLTREIPLSIQNVNDPPTGVNLSGQLYEHVFGAVVGELTVVDPDPDDQHSFTVSDSRFEVAEGRLKLLDGVAVDAEAEPVITLQIGISDTGTPPLSVQAELNIPVIPNDAPWQNRNLNNDVDNDGTVEPQDALIILNELNEGGPRPLDGTYSGGHFYDVNGDGLLTPLDALIVVNELNTNALGSSEVENEQPPQGTLPADGLVPEGEALADGSFQIEVSPSQPQPLFLGEAQSGNDEAMEEEEDWLLDQRLKGLFA